MRAQWKKNDLVFACSQAERLDGSLAQHFSTAGRPAGGRIQG